MENEDKYDNLRISGFKLFWEFFKISLFVVGGGYAIIVVADEIFGKRLKWLKEGELLARLPVFQMIPGLIAGNTAIYTGYRLGGWLGSIVALLGVVLPSYLVFLAVVWGYQYLPLNNIWVEGALLGLRSSLLGIILGTVIKGWRKSVIGIYGYVVVTLGTLLLIILQINVVTILLGAMLIGIIWSVSGGKCGDTWKSEVSVISERTSGKLYKLGIGIICVGVLIGICVYPQIAITFIKYGLLCFGGGFVLVPMYLRDFVGPNAKLLQMPTEDFANLMALTQATPGPVSVNSATFFGFHLGGIGGAAVATITLVLPSLFLLILALSSLDRWHTNRVVRGLLWGVKPATNALMLQAAWVFMGISVWQINTQTINYGAIIIAFNTLWLFTRGLLDIRWLLGLSALGGVLTVGLKIF